MSEAPICAYIALGSNLGDRSAHITSATRALEGLPNSALIAVSPVLETAPVGPVEQGNFLNAAASIHTSLSPRQLLNHLQRIELNTGRVRIDEQRWGPRTLDLDLLLYGELILAEPGLMIPHPRMHERDFVLRPLSHIAPDAVHPVLKQSIRWLLDSLAH